MHECFLAISGLTVNDQFLSLQCSREIIYLVVSVCPCALIKGSLWPSTITSSSCLSVSAINGCFNWLHVSGQSFFNCILCLHVTWCFNHGGHYALSLRVSVTVLCSYCHLPRGRSGMLHTSVQLYIGIRHLCRTPLCRTPRCMPSLLYTFVVVHICRTHLSYTFVVHICRTHILYTFVVHICRTHLSYTYVVHICVQLYINVYNKGVRQMCTTKLYD